MNTVKYIGAIKYYQMDFETISSAVVDCDRNEFLKTVDIWINRPNVCSKIISCAKVEMLQDISEAESILDVLFANLETKDIRSIGKDNHEEVIHSNQFKIVSIREIIPKKPNLHQPCREMIIFWEDSVVFIPLLDGSMSVNHEHPTYSLNFSSVHFEEKFEHEMESVAKEEHLEHLEHQQMNSTKSIELKIMLKCKCENEEYFAPEYENSPKLKTCFPTAIWLKEKLLPQIVKWCEEESKKRKVSTKKDIKMDLPPSLSLILQHKYAAKYQNLKEKYGPGLIKEWKEVTDPQKYIYEDIAIATYLILLWQKEREQTGLDRLQSFVDLGCGNGLLVHILNSEGHPGKGIDLRRRNIWDIYPQSENLVEAVIDPTDGTTYRDYDWLLGNHSDELTPWMPVMAARCGYNTRYWVLPCCFFDFFRKYERSQSLFGQYGDYLNFVKEIGLTCGFNVEVDVMRIPSTKRVCHVGMSKSYPPEKHDEVLAQIEKYIESRSSTSISGRNIDGEKFEARDKTVKVRNCTKIDRSIQDDVVSKVSRKLLEKKNVIKLRLDGHEKEWNKGDSIRLEEVTLLLDDHVKSLMKNECGGVQTLLRNHHQVFRIENGKVSIRDWSNLSSSVKKPRKHIKKNSRKTKKCWFYENHPDGCPRVANECPFKHGDEDK